MGLVKQRETENGVPLSYHRITSITLITNEQNVIEVSGYITKAKRQEEAEALAAARETGTWPNTSVYIDTLYLSAPYDPAMTVEDAYDWLKEQEQFEGAEDEDTAYTEVAQEAVADIPEEEPEPASEPAGEPEPDIPEPDGSSEEPEA